MATCRVCFVEKDDSEFSIELRPLKTPYALAEEEGLEPPTPGFGDRCSTN